MRYRAAALALVLSAVCAVAGCSGSGTSSGAKSSGATGSPAASPAGPPSASSAAGTNEGATTPAARTTSETALTLQSLLGQHSLLACDMMRARIRGDADLAESANAALGTNAASLAGALTPLLPADARGQFADAWGRHVQALFEYARGAASGDTEVKAKAKTDLVAFETQLADVVAAQSQGRLDRSAALAALRMHVDHLLEGADAYAAKDYAGSAALYRTSYQHTFDLGGTLATALAPPAEARTLTEPAIVLRGSLTKLLGEHVGLALATMRSSVGDENDLAAMGAALDGNTKDLTAAMESLYGAPAARQFQTQWADHVDALLAYTKAANTGDDAGKREARLTLDGFEQEFAAFLSTATGNRLPQAGLATTLADVDRTVIDGIQAYADRSYARSHELGNRLYTQMFAVSGQLAGGISATLGSRLPRGGSQAGGGGLATATTTVGAARR